MCADSAAFSGFLVDDLDKARIFYRDTLGLDVSDNSMRLLNPHLPTGGVILIYPMPDHVPATFTILNFPVTDIDAAVDDLNARGVVTKIYDGFTDERGISRPPDPQFGPPISWFRDRAGNVPAVLVG